MNERSRIGRAAEPRHRSFRFAQEREARDAAEDVLNEWIAQSNGHSPPREAVLKRLDWLRIEREARHILAAETHGQVVLPELVRLDDFLAAEDEEPSWRIQGLWPSGLVINAAPRKAGKTTLNGNLVRSLVDGDPFLDHFEVERVERKVVLIDDEMNPRQLRRWLQEQSIQNQDRVHVVSLRGHVRDFNIVVSDIRKRWAEQLGEVGAEVVLLDCLGPVLTACDLTESNDDIGRFEEAWEGLMLDAGVADSKIDHHTGHIEERARGGSKLRGWPDTEWKLMYDKENGKELEGGPRFFWAYGRDVDVPETQLYFNSVDRRLSLGSVGHDRRRLQDERLALRGLRWLAENPGRPTDDLKDGGLGGRGGKQSRVVKMLETEGYMRREPTNSALLCFITEAGATSVTEDKLI